jgi:hypothetical protein
MTNLDAILSISIYPIPVNTVERYCVDRGIVSSIDYTKEIGISKEFELITADVYDYLSEYFDIKEQDSSINGDVNLRDIFRKKANEIYAKYEDPKFKGQTIGFVGEDWNA